MALKWKNILICKTWNLSEMDFPQCGPSPSWSWTLIFCFAFKQSVIVFESQSSSLEVASTCMYVLRFFHAFPEERNSDLHEIPIFYNSPMVREPRRKSLPWRYRRTYEFVETWSWEGLVTCWLLKSSSMGNVSPRDSVVCVFLPLRRPNACGFLSLLGKVLKTSPYT